MDGRIRAAALVLAGLIALGGAALPTAANASPTVALPPPGGRFDYQLGGAYTPAADVEIVGRDSTAVPAGRYDVCYVNGFQTQPQDARSWRTHAPQLLLRRNGKPYHDPGWPDEYLLDVSTAAKRAAILARVAPAIRTCAAKGFDAVEIDNLDSWTRSHHAFGIRSAIAMARAYADLAHSLGLAVAQKNAAGHSARMRKEVGFDFAVAEECIRYTECGDYLRAYGQRVYDIEYGRLDCGAAGRPESVILRDRQLVPAGHAAYVDRSC